jgi:hypothetical protein
LDGETSRKIKMEGWRHEIERAKMAERLCLAILRQGRRLGALAAWQAKGGVEAKKLEPCLEENKLRF